AGDDLDVDAILLQRRDHAIDLGRGWIGEREETDELEIVLVLAAIRRLDRDRAPSDREHTRPVAGELVGERLCAGAAFGREPGAAREHLLRGALRDHRAAARILDDDGGAPALEVEWDLVDLGIRGALAARPAQRDVERVADA